MRIFVSSTFEDLREYRETAVRGLRQLGHEIIAMEDFTAANAPPVELVMERVAKCDVYVGIFAWKYGYIPKQGPATLPIGANINETSITHIEFLYARQEGKTILAFLLDESVPWPPHKIDAFAQIQTPDSIARPPGSAIKELRRDLQQAHTVAYFTSPADLEARVTTAVANHRMSEGIQTNLVHLTQPIGDPLSDSYVFGGIREEIQRAMGTAQRMSTIDIENEWWSTRLYLLAAMAMEFTRIVRIIVFHDKEFVGMLSTATVLSRLQPTNRKLGRFLSSLRGVTVRAKDQEKILESAETGWAKLFSGKKEAEEKLLVTRPNLSIWFSDAMFGHPVEMEDLTRATLLDLAKILSYPNDFVPVRTRIHDTTKQDANEDPSERRWVQAPITVVDKRALNDKLAQQHLEELMDKARLR